MIPGSRIGWRRPGRFGTDRPGWDIFPPVHTEKCWTSRNRARISRAFSFVSDLFGGCFIEAAAVSAMEAVKRCVAGAESSKRLSKSLLSPTRGWQI